MIAVDASLVLKLFLNEPDSGQVRSQWQQWGTSGELIVAPPLFRPEALSVLRRSVHRRILSEEEGNRAFEALEKLEIEIREPPTLYHVAWQLAHQLNRPTIYDCCYVALGDILSCDFWTADRRLANAIGNSLPWVKSL